MRFEGYSATCLCAAGIYYDYALTQLDVRSGTSNTRNVGVGAYLTLLSDNGWFADIVASVDRYSNKHNAKTPNHQCSF